MANSAAIRSAATLMLAAKTVGDSASRAVSKSNPSSNSVNHGYRFLGLMRGKASPSFPNSYVFPGGIVDKVDFSSKWVDVFRRRGESSWASDLGLLKTRTAEPRPQVLQSSAYTKWMTDGDALPPEAALRLTAIRETFEECGILLARPNSSGISPDIPVVTLESRLGDVESLTEWQERVQKDPLEFINLCLELDCCPDVWALHEWANWITPRVMVRRFDTLFFICELDNEPPVCCNINEIRGYKWESLAQFLDLHRQKCIFLPPPQFYEMNRLLNLIKTGHLQRFFVQSRHSPVVCYLPVHVLTKDGFMFVLPGDDLYPKNPDNSDGDNDSVSYDRTIDELRRSSTFLNRSCALADSSTAFEVFCNLKGNADRTSKDIQFAFTCL